MSKSRWKNDTLAATLDRFPLRKQEFVRSGGERLEDLYGPEEPPADIGLPGEFPYTRGIRATGYRGRLWTMRQYAGFGTADESNARYRYLLEQGPQGSASRLTCLPRWGLTQTASLRLERSKVGVAIDSIADMRRLFDGIPLDKVSTSMTINATASTLLAMYLGVAEDQGVPWSSVRGTIQNDVLKEYMARGTYIYPPRAVDANHHGHLRLLQGISAAVEHHFHLGVPHPRSGEAPQLRKSRLPSRTALPTSTRPSLQDSTWMSSRRGSASSSTPTTTSSRRWQSLGPLGVWARIMRDRFGAKSPRSWQMRFHTQTAGSTLTAQQVDNNVVRVALQALSAVMGGTQSLHTNSRDEALALPTESSARLALRTQQLIAAESGVADFVDPLAGSYVVEQLTDELEASASSLIGEVDSLGGMVSAIEAGFPQRKSKMRHIRLSWPWTGDCRGGRRERASRRLAATDGPPQGGRVGRARAGGCPQRVQVRSFNGAGSRVPRRAAAGRLRDRQRHASHRARREE